MAAAYACAPPRQKAGSARRRRRWRRAARIAGLAAKQAALFRAQRPALFVQFAMAGADALLLLRRQAAEFLGALAQAFALLRLQLAVVVAPLTQLAALLRRQALPAFKPCAGVLALLRIEQQPALGAARKPVLFLSGQGRPVLPHRFQLLLLRGAELLPTGRRLRRRECEQPEQRGQAKEALMKSVRSEPRVPCGP